jgi:C-terminal processing protease CtpA/Prc
MQSAQTIQQLADIEEGIPLWGCLPGSPSARAGMRYGDIITWIDTHRVKSVADYARAMKAREINRVTVRFIRDGKEYETTLELADIPEDHDLDEVAQQIVKERMMPIPRDGKDKDLPQA